MPELNNTCTGSSIQCMLAGIQFYSMIPSVAGSRATKYHCLHARDVNGREALCAAKSLRMKYLEGTFVAGETI